MLRSDPLLALLSIIAVARLTRLATTDFILDRPRAWIQAHGGTHLAYLVQCPWCLSIYTAAAVGAGDYFWWRRTGWQMLLLGLTASMLTGIIAQLSDLIDAGFTVTHEQAEDAKSE